MAFVALFVFLLFLVLGVHSDLSEFLVILSFLCTGFYLATTIHGVIQTSVVVNLQELLVDFQACLRLEKKLYERLLIFHTSQLISLKFLLHVFPYFLSKFMFLSVQHASSIRAQHLKALTTATRPTSKVPAFLNCQVALRLPGKLLSFRRIRKNVALQLISGS